MRGAAALLVGTMGATGRAPRRSSCRRSLQAASTPLTHSPSNMGRSRSRLDCQLEIGFGQVEINYKIIQLKTIFILFNKKIKLCENYKNFVLFLNDRKVQIFCFDFVFLKTEQIRDYVQIRPSLNLR